MRDFQPLEMRDFQPLEMRDFQPLEMGDFQPLEMWDFLLLHPLSPLHLEVKVKSYGPEGRPLSHPRLETPLRGWGYYRFCSIYHSRIYGSRIHFLP